MDLQQKLNHYRGHQIQLLISWPERNLKKSEKDNIGETNGNV